MISEKRGAFWNPKNQCFHRNRGSFQVKVSDFFNMENTDGLHKFPVSGGTGVILLSFKYLLKCIFRLQVSSFKEQEQINPHASLCYLSSYYHAISYEHKITSDKSVAM